MKLFRAVNNLAVHISTNSRDVFSQKMVPSARRRNFPFPPASHRTLASALNLEMITHSASAPLLSVRSAELRSFTNWTHPLGAHGEEAPPTQGGPPPMLQSLGADDGDPEEIELEKISVTKRYEIQFSFISGFFLPRGRMAQKHSELYKITVKGLGHASFSRKKFLRDHNIPYDAGFTSLKIPCLLGCCAEGVNPDQKMAAFMKKIATCENRDLMINDNTGLFMCVNCHRQGLFIIDLNFP